MSRPQTDDIDTDPQPQSYQRAREFRCKKALEESHVRSAPQRITSALELVRPIKAHGVQLRGGLGVARRDAGGPGRQRTAG